MNSKTGSPLYARHRDPNYKFIGNGGLVPGPDVRECNETELAKLAENRCPDCLATNFRQIARGLICINIQCEACGAKFNVSAVPTFGQRIGKDTMANLFQTEGGS